VVPRKNQYGSDSQFTRYSRLISPVTRKRRHFRLRYTLSFLLWYSSPVEFPVGSAERPASNMPIKMGDDGVGVSVPVFGILSPDFGCSCEHHAICGTNTYLDMVVRFKTTIVEGGMCFFFVLCRSCFCCCSLFFLFLFRFAGPRGLTAICAAFWVTDGTDRCIIGRVSEEFKAFFPRLEGRIAQVVEIFPNSDEPRKRTLSQKKYGVCHVMLIDKFMEGDMAMLDLLDMHDA